MSINCNVVLPSNVRINDVATVIGIACGGTKTKLTITNFWVTRVNNVTVVNSSYPSMVQISINNMSEICSREKGETTGFTYYHFESDEYIGQRLLSPTSTVFWLAVGKKLVDFFGGTLIFDDYSEKPVKYSKKKKSNEINHPTDGLPYYNFQKRLYNLKPLEKSDFDTIAKLSERRNYEKDR